MTTPLQAFKARMRPGARVILIAYEIGHKPATHRYMNVARECMQARSTFFTVAAPGGQESYADWPKASELIWTEPLVARIHSAGVTLTYRFEDNAAK